MGRETNAAREVRLKRAGAWLKARRADKGWTQAELAKRLDVNQVQVSTYERGAYEVDGELARDVARVLGLPEYDTWRGLELPLPAEVASRRKAIRWALNLMTDQDAADLYERLVPLIRTRARGAKRGSGMGQGGGKSTRPTRPGEKPAEASSDEDCAI